MGPSNAAKQAQPIGVGNMNGGGLTPGGLVSWKQMQPDQKIEVLLRVVQEQRKIIERAGKTINKLTRHKHDERGFPSLEVPLMDSIHEEREERMFSVLDEIDFS